MRVSKKYTNEEEKNIAKEYINGASSGSLCKKYGFKTQKSILDKVKKYYGNDYVRTATESMNIAKNYPEFHMDIIDSKFKAYFLGIVASDGCIHEDNYCENHDYVEISMTDKDVIEYISSSLGREMHAYARPEGCTKNRKTIYRVNIYDQALVNELENNYNITPRKSKTLKGFKWRRPEYKYIPYFVRGYIDGNGWIRKDGKEFYICSGSKDFILWMKDILESFLYMDDLNYFSVYNEGYGEDLFHIRTALNKNINILKDVIYDMPFGMSRKYNLLHDQPSETIISATLN